MMTGAVSRRFAAVAVLAALSATAGCRSSTGPDEDEPNIASIHITANPGTAASSTAIITIGVGQSAPLVLIANQDNEVVVRFLDPTGADDAIVSEHRAEYELEFENLGGMEYTPLVGFPKRGILRPTTVGPATIRLVLFNEDHGHAEVSRDLVVNVVAP